MISVDGIRIAKSRLLRPQTVPSPQTLRLRVVRKHLRLRRRTKTSYSLYLHRGVHPPAPPLYLLGPPHYRVPTAQLRAFHPIGLQGKVSCNELFLRKRYSSGILL